MNSNILLEENAAVTKSGQVSLPRDIAKQLGISYGKDRLRYTVQKNGTVIIRREPTFWESLEDLQSSLSPEQQKTAQRLAGKSVNELKEDWADSPAGQKEFKERFGA